MARSISTPAIDALQDVGLGLFAKTLQPGDFVLLTSSFELLNRLDPEFVVQCFDFLRAKARNVEHGNETRRCGRFQFLVIGQFAGANQFGNFLLDGFTDALYLFEPILRNKLAQWFAKAFERPGGVVVGPGLEWVLALEFQQCGDADQNLRYLVFVHKSRLAQSPRKARGTGRKSDRSSALLA